MPVMRSSTVCALLCATLALASPIVKKDIVTDVVTIFDYIYLESTPPVIHAHHTHHHHKPSTTSTSTSTTPTSTSSSSTSPPCSYSVPVVETPQLSPALTTTVTPAFKPEVLVVVTPPPPPPAAPTTTVVPPASTSEAPAVVAAVSPTPAYNAASPTDFTSTCTYHHNIHRQNHSAPAVTWDADLASSALTLAKTCNFHHDVTIGKGGYGQNIASYGYTSGTTGIGQTSAASMAISDAWYNGELPLFLPTYYGEANPDMANFEAWGHFSQVVWVGSTTIGCASVMCPSPSMGHGFDTWFTVCNYGPAGNMGGEYGTNILQPLGHPFVSA